MKIPLTVLIALMFSISAMAKPKRETYKAKPSEVFVAALAVARTHHVVTYVDRKDMLFTFETGTSLTSYGFVCNASVQPAKHGATLTLNVQKKPGPKGFSFSWGAGGRLAKKFFKEVGKRLKRNPKKSRN